MKRENERGIPFGKLLEKDMIFSEPKLLQMILPILESLRQLHEKGGVYRNINPFNIFILTDNSGVLLDSSKAQESQKEKGFDNSVNHFIGDAYVPFEQYNIHGEQSQQGPWTDIYALAATLYYAIRRKKPKDAIFRASAMLDGRDDPYESLAECNGNDRKYSTNFLRAIDAALNFKAHQRPQSVETWLKMLQGKSAVPSHNSGVRSKTTGVGQGGQGSSREHRVAAWKAKAITALDRANSFSESTGNYFFRYALIILGVAGVCIFVAAWHFQNDSFKSIFSAAAAFLGLTA